MKKVLQALYLFFCCPVLLFAPQAQSQNLWAVYNGEPAAADPRSALHRPAGRCEPAADPFERKGTGGGVRDHDRQQCHPEHDSGIKDLPDGCGHPDGPQYRHGFDGWQSGTTGAGRTDHAGGCHAVLREPGCSGQAPFLNGSVRAGAS